MVHSKSLSLLAVTALSAITTAVAFPAPNPIAEPNPSPSSVFTDFDTAHFWADLQPDTDSGKCTIEFEMPQFRCTSGMGAVMDYNADKDLCYVKQSDFEALERHDVCGSGTVKFNKMSALEGGGQSFNVVWYNGPEQYEGANAQFELEIQHSDDGIWSLQPISVEAKAAWNQS